MKKIKEIISGNTNRIATVLAFLTAYGFFQFAYPYHLMRREQMTLFLYDWDYIRQTYKGIGWLVRLVSDFLQQFFHLPVVGPLVIASALTVIAVTVYRICSRYLSQRASLIIAAVCFIWSFLRETGNLYTTRYTLVVLGYLIVVLLSLKFKKTWSKAFGAVVLAAFAVWSLGSPVHRHYGKLCSVPRIEYDRIIGLDDQVAREHWDKVLKLSRKDLYMTEASYCYNLAQAMKDNLGQSLFDHSQNGTSTLLIRVGTDQIGRASCRERVSACV